MAIDTPLLVIATEAAKPLVRSFLEQKGEPRRIIKSEHSGIVSVVNDELQGRHLISNGQKYLPQQAVYHALRGRNYRFVGKDDCYYEITPTE